MFYAWPTSQLNRCGTTVNVGAPRDVQICNGQLVESVNDGGQPGNGNGAQTVLAMYPRQPFDFAGRTGKVVFDVSNDTQGSHMAWPAFVLTDQPVPAPHDGASSLADFARNSFGVSFAADCQNGQQVEYTQTADSWTVDKMFTTSNYAYNESGFSAVACVKKATALGQMNHIEIRISPTHVEVWATDAGSPTLKQIAIANLNMPLTRGLVWMEDVHYNACKAPGTQCNHTFAWDNFGFDGPVLPRDLGFDVQDATHNGTSGGSLGYLVPTGNSLSLQIPNVQGVENAAAVLLEFTWWPHDLDSITYSLNGHPAHTTTWPYGSAGAFQSHTLAMPVPQAEVVNGTNSLTLTSTDNQYGGVDVANIDLIPAGAGAPGSGGNTTPPTPTPTATTVPPTATSTATAVPPTATPKTTHTYGAVVAKYAKRGDFHA